MAKFKLKDNHPLIERIERAMQAVEAERLSFHYGSMGTVAVTDTETDRTYIIEDIDGDDGFHNFPIPTEYKVTFRKPN